MNWQHVLESFAGGIGGGVVVVLGLWAITAVGDMRRNRR